MTPKVYVGTAGMSVWFSEDGGDRWERPYSEWRPRWSTCRCIPRPSRTSSSRPGS